MAVANPIPDPEWKEILARPGRYLREPSERTRLALVRTLANGDLVVFLETPDTLALIVRHLETFAPLFIASQTRPNHPDPWLQSWFRASAPGHREEMIRALMTWFAPGSDSVAPFHSIGITGDGDRLAMVQAEVAVLLADWDARKALPDVRALKGQLKAEAPSLGADARASIEGVDQAIQRLEGGTGDAPLAPDGRGGFRLGRRASQIVSARVRGRRLLDPAEEQLGIADREALWSMVAAARETAFARSGGPEMTEFGFDDGARVQLGFGAGWGELRLFQEPYPAQCLLHPALYARLLVLTESAPPPSALAASRARFRREQVLLTIDRDSIRVEGRYEFLSDSAARPFAIRLPAVEREDVPQLRDWDARLEHARPGESVVRHRGRNGFVIFPGAAGDTVRVIASSGDRLYGRRRAIYLLTTARAWNEPLDRALLEVDWPDSLGKPRFSLPLERIAHAAHRTRYRFQAESFLPDTDLVVAW